ncbi:phosphoribose diphosphate--decaprenyl-phosphate phosphoribosyltransferase [candidate division WOR-1 bacterium RIFOXYA12_FULL_52_29]|uniref:Phosphoribose diphosphate--decaprenyl-phosphate phosphoribosyltransferase n=1 Tax=candidate division WOR-1 bacterium RIFOXYC12_FULL_54_18 TaxID=1802584 RepID=A0A1F4T678_UNCSA|nr:MAG: phosphoribose diphosphate--decaprenyl-phosphate phosphoribosyltransferase [candidate division WOR-1 bacterium RIFOXYA2_FULL_51_19]OGC17787.1 MAG: phosphoribose diphosphate--decaprenyl-phosphate phosphoribosyltransferase [candidate division WOR-1 bacterium RIFOXYA12_FULL_52_29]OGC26644.1 MAG: phosphoribose diphosphate--decaprenyl-phosphate phosphoribosyltransferase [candidate division WOR-1 bacterium RIFOXYB2_FULL_45_9]OGC28204.1 MAG: phosphoribose diphosphate--decaprenyl-phosphate phosph
MIPILLSLRPKQWTKNFFVFAGIIFSLEFFHLAPLLKVIDAFIVFCAISSAMYLVNDIKDLEFDKKHPLKKLRPIASGKVSPSLAIFFAFLLILTALPISFMLNSLFGWVVVSYLVLMFSYTFFLKNIVILDVFSIAAGFVLRAIAGVVVIDVILSPWLVICTILLALFIALGKRRHELLSLDLAAEHRQILDEYNPRLLDQLISAVAGSTVMAYALYTLWPETIAKFGTNSLVYSIPFVLYGIFRYLYLIYKRDEGGQPEKTLLSDPPLLIDIFLWIAALTLIIYVRL